MKTLFEAVGGFVQQRLTAVGTTNNIASNAIQYRWEHSLRVTTIRQQLACDEHANEQHVVLDCLLQMLQRWITAIIVITGGLAHRSAVHFCVS